MVTVVMVAPWKARVLNGSVDVQGVGKADDDDSGLGLFGGWAW